MRICSNCGSSNGDDAKVCRRCGAVLPVSSEPPKVRIQYGNASNNAETVKENKKKQQSFHNNKTINSFGELKFFSGRNVNNNKKAQQEQYEKPKPNKSELQNIPNKNTPKNEEDSFKSRSINYEYDKKEYLKEIDPIPFDGSFLTPSYKKENKKREKSDLIDETEQLSTKKKSSPNIPDRKKRLAKDMKSVLSFLSERLPSSELTSKKELSQEKFKSKKELIPENINEVLKELLNIDIHIEASAILNNNGRILASAISDRASDSLFATIAQNLFMIGVDIIEGLNAGTLHSITLRGTDGILDLAPLYYNTADINDNILIIFSNPKVKSGIIQIASAFVKKQLKRLLQKNNQ